MAWTFGFFNSVNGDRRYNADQMSDIFEGLLTDGIFESIGNKLAVEPNDGMVIQINTGRGWFGKRWLSNTSALLITLNDSDVLLNRYVAIGCRVDKSDAVREVQTLVKYSDFATEPLKPLPERTETVQEFIFAYVYIPAGATSISASNIEDTRNNQELCGWVTGLIEQIDVNTLYTQFTALFNEWFEGLQDKLDENVETRLVAALPENITLTLLTSGWVSGTEGGFEQDVQVVGMNETKSVLVQPAQETKDDYMGYEISCIEQHANSLKFKASSIPLREVLVDVIHMGE